MKKQTKDPGLHDVSVFKRGWPLLIHDGQLERDSIAQTAHFRSKLFEHFEHQGKRPVQANIELKVIVEDN